MSCNLKTIAFREFCLNMLFTYLWVTYNIVAVADCIAEQQLVQVYIVPVADCIAEQQLVQVFTAE